MTTRRLAMMALFSLCGLFTQEASAWYDSQLGRWLTRDPIGYLGKSRNLYEYVNGMAVIKLDPSGLITPIEGWPGIQPPGFFPDGTQYTPQQCCDAAMRSGEVPPGIGAGVVCCNGKKITCAWRSGIPKGIVPPNPTAESISTSCQHEHEKTHFDDVVDCDEYPCGKRPPWKPGMSEDDKEEEECNGHTAQLNCLRRKLGDCNGDKDCELIIRSLITVQESIVDELCN